MHRHPDAEDPKAPLPLSLQDAARERPAGRGAGTREMRVT